MRRQFNYVKYLKEVKKKDEDLKKGVKLLSKKNKLKIRNYSLYLSKIY